MYMFEGLRIPIGVRLVGQSKIMGEGGRGSSGWMRTLEEVRMGTGLGLGCPLE